MTGLQKTRAERESFRGPRFEVGVEFDRPGIQEPEPGRDFLKGGGLDNVNMLAQHSFLLIITQKHNIRY